MIYTLTLNPAVDLELQIDQFQFNSVARAKNSRMDCGGKGFNVSRMLRNVNIESTAMGFIGGYNGQRLQTELTSLGIKTNFTEISGETRTNVSIVAHGEQRHIKVNETGPEISSVELANLITAIKQNLKAGDWWVLGGSLPSGVDSTIYAELITLIENAGAFAVLDSSGEALRLGCLAKPTLAKPNLDEAKELLGLSDEGLDDADLWCKALAKQGPKNLVVSLGEEGALYVSGQAFKKISSPEIIEANPIGAGDSMVAGIVWRLSLGETLQKALPYGLACGAATASRPGTELGSLEQVTELVHSIKI
ncbi:1-phosphofructokinase [Psychromonas sp. RZ22]|uniref:1-phosphofructokinase n=1 Tax=Psychromonas algarum TaxID=2555643 RepID=UPI00106750CE|nr:1-phosphofructokinase [Psychromonas sp. RZ22]TEW55526.1 1-phosphofructokinase [Psychromonas sp. RZ22]